MLKDSFCFLINCVRKIILPFRLEALMCCTATMPMVKEMKIFKDAVIGCLKSECVKSYLHAFYRRFVLNLSICYICSLCVYIIVCHEKLDVGNINILCSVT
jgi:hypothetical protein